MIRILILVTLGFAGISFAAERQAFLPLKPGELLNVLPPTPSGWKLTRSEAETNFGGWYETRASRSFEAPADVASTGGSGGRVEVSVVDTGGFQRSLVAFANFKTEKSEGFEKALLGSIPIIHFAGANDERASQALVDQRYLVEIQIAGLPQQTAEMWLRTLKFRAVPPQPNPSRIAVPKEVRLHFIDELKPSNNRAYTVALTSAVALEKTLKTLPQLPETPSKEAAASADSLR
jgi:hypothetical protein